MTSSYTNHYTTEDLQVLDTCRRLVGLMETSGANAIHMAFKQTRSSLNANHPFKVVLIAHLNLTSLAELLLDVAVVFPENIFLTGFTHVLQFTVG
jgi:hypothetical protein